MDWQYEADLSQPAVLAGPIWIALDGNPAYVFTQDSPTHLACIGQTSSEPFQQWAYTGPADAASPPMATPQGGDIT